MLNLCLKNNFPAWIDLRSNSGCPDVLDDSILNISPISSVVNCIRYLLKYTDKKDFNISRLYLYYYTENIDIKNILKFIKPRFFRLRHLKNKHISCLFLFFIILRHVSC